MLIRGGNFQLKARIIKVNYQKGTAVFEIDDEYGWLEILDSTELEPEETVFGDFSNLGGTKIKKEDGETVDVFIQDFCSLQVAMNCVFPKR